MLWSGSGMRRSGRPLPKTASTNLGVIAVSPNPSCRLPRSVAEGETVRLLRVRSGLDLQVWRDDCLVLSHFFPSPPQPEQWVRLLRGWREYAFRRAWLPSLGSAGPSLGRSGGGSNAAAMGALVAAWAHSHPVAGMRIQSGGRFVLVVGRACAANAVRPAERPGLADPQRTQPGLADQSDGHGAGARFAASLAGGAAGTGSGTVAEGQSVARLALSRLRAGVADWHRQCRPASLCAAFHGVWEFRRCQGGTFAERGAIAEPGPAYAGEGA